MSGLERVAVVWQAATLSFAPGAVSKTISISTRTDFVAEGLEAFNVTLGSPTGGAVVADATGGGVVIARATGTATISTDD